MRVEGAGLDAAPTLCCRNRCRRGLALFLVLFGACAREPAPPLAHDAYVWQRQWTPAVAAAVRERSAGFSGLRVLALQQLEQGPLELQPDLDALRERGLPLRAVLRMEGSRPRANAAALAAQISASVARWRAVGLRVEGVEVDHDCALAGLADYVAWLRRFRAGLDPDGALSVTALPSWLEAPEALAALREITDETVLQVHAVDARRLSLIDTAQSLRWAQAWQAHAARPFRLALPAYSLRLRIDRNGRVQAIDAEGALDRAGAGALERHADPVAVAAIVRALNEQRLPQLRGLLWFRLPVAGDRRSWSAQTLARVMGGGDVRPRLQLQAVDRGQGRFDLLLANVGELDGIAPQRIDVDAGCRLLEGLSPWRASEQTGTLQSSEAVWLSAGAQRPLGFARCRRPLAASRPLLAP
jgi:hypothetical protein